MSLDVLDVLDVDHLAFERAEALFQASLSRSHRVDDGLEAPRAGRTCGHGKRAHASKLRLLLSCGCKLRRVLRRRLELRAGAAA